MIIALRTASLNKCLVRLILSVQMELTRLCCLVIVVLFLSGEVTAYPGQMQKRLSRQTLIRLMLRNERQGNDRPIKRDVERRSVDEADDFQNCFLSPVQCMLPRSRK